MRIRRLNLLKYGHFEDAPIDLPHGDADLHIIYGDNEAGKSTALAALENLLFGFPKSTPYNFKFAAPKLRVGAVLEDDDSSFEYLRRKGNKETIVDDDGKSIADGEKRLAALLKGVDLPFFQRMFFLNHHRLRKGADDLLTVGDDAGETLLASGSGIQGLSEILRGYDETADSLWAKTGGQKRAFTQANKRLSEAKKAEREASVNVTTYRRFKREAEQALADYERAREALETKQSRLTKLERIRRVYRNVQSLIETEAEIEGLGVVVALPHNAADQLDESARELKQLGANREMHEQRIEKRRAFVASLPIDKALLQRASDIEALGKERVILEREREALPRRREDLASLMEDIHDQIGNLGWTLASDQTPKKLLPGSPVVTKARNHAGQYGKVSLGLEGAKKALNEAIRQLEHLKESSTAIDASVDAKALRAAFAAAREGRKGVGAREQAEQQREKARRQVAQSFSTLAPAIQTVDDLRAMSVPSEAVIENHRNAVLSLANERESTVDSLAKLQGQIAENRERAESRRSKSGVLTDSDLQTLRAERDKAWLLLSRRHLEKHNVPEDEWAERFGEDTTGQTVYEKLVVDADKGADDRFDKAELVARLNELEDRIDSDELRVKTLTTELSRLNQRLEDLAAEWDSLWVESGVSPSSPDQMLIWCRTREACLERQIEVDEATVEIEQQETEESRLIKAVLGEIQSLGVENTFIEDASLDAVIEYANEVVQEIKAEHDSAKTRAESIKDAEKAVKERKSACSDAKDVLDAWQTRWESILSELRLDTNIVAGDVEDYLVLMDAVRSNITEADNVRRDRIEKIERDINLYEERAKDLAAVVAKDLLESSADEIVFALQSRLASSQTNQEKQAEAEVEIENDTDSLDKLLQSERDSKAIIEELHRLAGTDSADALQEAINRSDKNRQLTVLNESLVKTLEADGDGHSIADLKAEVDGIDLDKAAAEAQSLDGEVKSLTESMLPLRDEMQRTKTAFESIGGSGDAAVAASHIQSAYADMDSIAAAYVRARTSERLLRWGIDYFRKQKQGPMLEKATALFEAVTGGRYSRLIVEYDDDRPIIAGVDADGSTKHTTAMSDGTRDQLYLALKLAAVEDYIERAEPMPFVADDLFINFDDKRTAHALTALHGLSKRCQIVLFTHHAHMVEIARTTIGDGLSVKTLMA